MHKANTPTPDNPNFLMIENYKSNTCHECDFNFLSEGIVYQIEYS